MQQACEDGMQCSIVGTVMEAATKSRQVLSRKSYDCQQRIVEYMC